MEQKGSILVAFFSTPLSGIEVDWQDVYTVWESSRGRIPQEVSRLVCSFIQERKTSEY